ncbi:hypothetical protein MLD38_036915 [Melastoma candidum]|uniref:Uncharacterized protein n=1 Tax=Melastoma candidum TaxID=119954 RepID=A0ACB9LL37_9MYRT|nr:hypothetical protein MLD38_036915 [Melastoma candidum]
MVNDSGVYYRIKVNVNVNSQKVGNINVTIFCVLIFLTAKQRNRRRDPSTIAAVVVDDDAITKQSPQFDLEIIRAATENFSEANKLGQGGFGSVFRGKLPNGTEIAVKRLSQNSGQGESEFKNEARLLSRLQHRNLVKLLGYCLEGNERLLVYEFVPNASLDKFIFDPIKRTLLDWDTRYKIITGIARGLLYLHEDSRLRIIHRDLKASNILLDVDMNAKVSDFGTARLFEIDQTQADTSRIMGTYGYMAPEYVLRGNYSLKSDVFSFGVSVLEIVSGQQNLVARPGQDTEMLISNVWTNWREGNISSIVDPAVPSGYTQNILRCIHIGLLCVQQHEAMRPSMASVVLMLNSQSVTLPVPKEPAFLMNTSPINPIDISSGFDSTSSTAEANRSGDKASACSINDASITDPYPR